ncbi:peptidylprolyl isomerase, partial [Pseudoalteromonas ruthenica]
AVAGTDFILENELNNNVALQQQTRSIDYLVVTKESLQAGVAVSEQEIADYYELNQPQFLAPEQVSVSYIDLNAANLTLDSSVSEDDIKAYYEQNSAQYVEPEKR